jgi:hypothetical protein
VLELVDSAPAARLNEPPAPGKWSAAQILHHVVSSEGGSLQYIRKKTQTPDAVPRATLMCAVRTAVLAAALASPLKFKAPDVVANVPDKPPVDETLAQWSQIRDELEQMIGELPEGLLERALFRHPVGGRMNMSQTLDFMIAHLKRHSRQLRRTVNP